MALFPVNQNVQWFTANNVVASTYDLTNVGDITVDLTDPNKKYLVYKSNVGNKRSEVIEHQMYMKYTPADVMNFYPNRFKLDFASVTATANSSYSLVLTIPSYHAMSEYHTHDTSVTFSTGASVTLAQLIARCANALVGHTISNTFNSETSDRFVDEGMNECFRANTLRISGNTFNFRELVQDWIIGTMGRGRVYQLRAYLVDNTNNVTYNIPVTVETNQTGVSLVTNSADIADMEWFYLGEHGDQQRLVGYPNVHPVAITGNNRLVVVGGDTDYGYDLITIHHYYEGNGTFVQKSEMDIIIALPAKSDVTDESGETTLTAHALAQELWTALGGSNTPLGSTPVIE